MNGYFRFLRNEFQEMGRHRYITKKDAFGREYEVEVLKKKYESKSKNKVQAGGNDEIDNDLWQDIGVYNETNDLNY